MKTLHMHIGFCKTATSSIQHVLTQNKARLLENNFSLFCTDFHGQERKSGRAELWTPFGPKQKKDYDSTAERFAKEMSLCPCDNVLLTEETFSTAFEPQTLKMLHSALIKYFDCIKIYVYIRRQDRYAVSYLQEASNRISPILGLQECAGRALPVKHNLQTETFTKPIIFDESIEITDYFKILSMWGNLFGKENMYIGVFEPAQLKNGNIIIDFLHALNLDTKISFNQETHLAKSKGFEYTKVGHLLLQSKINQKTADFIRKFLDDSGKSLPSKADAQKFYATFREKNKRLNESFHISSNEYIFDDDFSDYPEESKDIWTEESANQAIINILKALSAMFDHVVQQVHEQLQVEHLKEIKAYKEKLKTNVKKNNKE